MRWEFKVCILKYLGKSEKCRNLSSHGRRQLLCQERRVGQDVGESGKHAGGLRPDRVWLAQRRCHLSMKCWGMRVAKGWWSETWGRCQQYLRTDWCKWPHLGVSGKVMEGWVLSGVRWYRPALALEGLLGDSPMANKTANVEDKPLSWSEAPLGSNSDSTTSKQCDFGQSLNFSESCFHNYNGVSNTH